jgi:hypothetical protein
MNMYRIITHDFHDICFQQESGGTESSAGLPEPGTMEETLDPKLETIYSETKGDPDSMPGISAWENNPVPITSEVSCLN